MKQQFNTTLPVILGLVGILSTAVAQPIPPEVQNSADQWPLANKDYANRRTADGAKISSANVHLLQPKWTFEFPAEAASFFGSAAANPIISEDVVYMQDLGSNIFALDLPTGSLLWEYRPNVTNVGPNGVAVGWGKVFGLNSEQSFAALNKQTGNELWSTDLSTHAGEGIEIQPTVYDGLVYMSTVPVTVEGALKGLVGYLPGGNGIIHALDQETGAIRWSFNTIDSPDHWGNPELNSGGGAWYTPAVDVDRGLTYWGIGNPAPWPGTGDFPNGSSRPGPNLYTNSILAIGHETGELEWFNQIKQHDLFDHDYQIPPILAEVSIKGEERDIVIGAGKMGTVHAFDRDTGEILWATDVGIHQNDDLAEVPPGETVDVFPGVIGGVETPMAYADGHVYVPVVNLASRFTSTQYLGEPASLVGGTGELTALDAATGAVLWNHEFNSMVLGGATVVNDLVFTSTFDGMIYALNRETGEEVWSYQAAGRINFLPAVAGDTIIFPVGFAGAAPPHLLTLSLVPEPSAWMLAITGLLVLLTRKRRHAQGRLVAA